MPSFIDAPALLAVLLAIVGGARDLGNFVSTDAYWNAKGVAVSVDQLKHELDPIKPADVAKPVGDLDADDPIARQAAADKIAAAGPGALPALEDAVKNGSPEASARAARLLVQIRAAYKPAYVRRLMAIRTLGEKKDASALPVLRPLLDSKEMFEADYARAAIAAIEGKPDVPRTATETERAADVGLLPARLDAVIQAAPTADGAFSLEKLIALLPFDRNHKQRTREGLTAKLIETLETAGNIRIDAITAGIYPAPPGVPGNYIVIIRGEFDATAVCAELGKFTPKPEIIGGVHVFHVDDDAAVLVSSNRRIIYLAREEHGELGIETMAAALKRGRGDLPANTDLAALLQSVDRTAPLWVAARLTPGWQQIAGPLSQFDDVTLVATQTIEKGKVVMHARLVANSSDPAQATAGVTAMRNLRETYITGFGQQLEAKPYLKPLLDFAESIKIDAEGKKMTMTGTFGDLPILMLPTLSIQDDQFPQNPAGRVRGR